MKLKIEDANFQVAFSQLLNRKQASDHQVRKRVCDIIDRVRQQGDEAVWRYTRDFDGFDPCAGNYRIGTDEIEHALQVIDPKRFEALKCAHERIEKFHLSQYPQGGYERDDLGVEMGWRWGPVDAAGLYVPGGQAAYPSSVLMNAIPAKVAKVPRLVMAVPTPQGIILPEILVAAYLSGVDEIYRMGGAQAIAALAYGTQTIKAVDKIVGPGNAYVAAAKREVFGQVGIDMIAGPSEVLVLADGKNDPQCIAMDLMAQAEHDQDAQSVFLTDDEDFAREVERAVEDHLKILERSKVAGESWRKNGAIILLESLDQGIDVINQMAPEHLELAIDEPEDYFKQVRHAGSVFLGRYTPEALGDYLGGPNHVLPTSRSARFSSGLGVLDYMKRTTFLKSDARALNQLADHVICLSQCEGLGAHGQSVALRCKKS